MAILPEADEWTPGIYQYEEEDVLQGGPDGMDNVQGKALANRTLWLKNQIAALSTGKQPLDAELTALAALVSAANTLPYFTGAGAAALTTLSAFARTLLDDADAAAARATLGANDASNLTTGTIPAARVPTLNQSTTGNAATATKLATARTINGVPFDGTANITISSTDGTKQPLDDELTALAALVSAANTLPYFTGAGAAALTTLSAFARTLLDDADAAAARATLGANDASNLTTGTIPAARVPTLNQSTTGNAATATKLATPRTINGVAFDGSANISISATDGTKQPLDDELTALAALVSAANTLPYFTGPGAAALTTLSAFARTLLDDADAATARTTLGINTGYGSSASASGYLKLPDWLGGFIIQWGQGSGTTSGTVTFPLAFPSACYGLWLQDATGTIFSGIARTLTQFNWSGAGSTGPNWFAIGK